jgi:hypothetical protein
LGQLRGHDFESITPAAIAATSVAPAAPPSVTMPTPNMAPASLAVIGGGLLIGVGSFLPWVTASTVFGSLSRSGVDRGGDGWVTLVAGSVITLLGLLTIRKANRGANLLVAIAAAVAFITFAIDLADVQGRISDLEGTSQGMALAGVGIGLWMVALGAVIAFASSLARRSRRRAAMAQP